MPASHSIVRRLAGVFLRLAVLLVSVALSLVTAEFALRFLYRDVRSSGRAGDYVARQGRGPKVTNNGYGFRDREIPPKSAARYRIVVLGDSFTWGSGLEVGYRFSNLLQDALGPGYEVFNFGVSGDDMPEHLERLPVALSVSPDFILLQLFINDFETREMDRPRPYALIPSYDYQLERTSILYGLLNRRWSMLQPKLGLVDSYDQYLAKNLKDPNGHNSQLAFGMLNQFIERARKAGVGTGTVLFPAADALGPYGSKYPFGYLHERVMTTCADQHVSCLDLLPTFSIAEPHTMWVSQFDAHPNAMANRWAAREILRVFAREWHRGKAALELSAPKPGVDSPSQPH
jgi:lysophospholipase L1-like esterase